jgi:hypothetical protein
MKNYLKPTDIDYYLQYVCPNSLCKNHHWLTKKEAQVNNFKIVCDCGEIFYSLPINKIKVLYKKKKTIENTKNEPLSFEQTKDEEITQEKESIESLKDRFYQQMEAIGLSDKKDISEIFDRAYSICPTHDISTLFRIGILEN